ncbi:Type IV secretion system protein VirB9 precursor [Candidatus Fokinia solitaria]|uniref:Type IV secretion system protein VirB9 n=1 Tax=Candidatus Fokinia solitaria TaxID=1802984 RepID=A0A2U8BRP7_9RICK|nr:TrbG/VirB9 family P-type conjugative transfer protein [Candidatus Fokinia solitaria]AWD33009.1 Type IV secretion system protein VirB9 precursor [Candidatus Fokinia solitaria]
MKFLKTIALLVVCSAFSLSYSSAANITPMPLNKDGRIKLIHYKPNSVIKFVGHYLYNSIIEFAPDEKIETILMGISSGWQLHPEGNRIFLKPINDNAETNMTVITNMRMYFFEMHAEEAKGVDDPNIAFVTKFVYAQLITDFPSNASSSTTGAMHQRVDTPPDLSKPSLYNFRYQISGIAMSIEPVLIFDDGYFTYFRFKEMNGSIPAIFAVNDKLEEAMVNYRISYGYVVVERVANRFTLRNGKDVICVFNDGYYRQSDTFKEIMNITNMS